MIEETPAQLVAHLSHPNGWWRDTAQRMLIVKGDKSVVPALVKMAESSKNHLARLHAMWTLEGLDALPKVTVHGRARDRTPTLMFTVDGLTSTEVAIKLAEREVAVWDGNYYAVELERYLGLAPHGAVRAGFVHYNDERDLERLIDAVESL